MQSITMHPVAGDEQRAIDVEKISVGTHPTEAV
jgi:hypothetical protein